MKLYEYLVYERVSEGSIFKNGVIISLCIPAIQKIINTSWKMSRLMEIKFEIYFQSIGDKKKFLLSKNDRKQFRFTWGAATLFSIRNEKLIHYRKLLHKPENHLDELYCMFSLQYKILIGNLDLGFCSFSIPSEFPSCFKFFKFMFSKKQRSYQCGD